MEQQQNPIKIPDFKLNNGQNMPICGLGTFQSPDEGKMTELLRKSFEAGYTHIDTAIIYGNHAIIGNALEIIFKEGKFKRSDIFITTKVFPTRDSNAIAALKQSLLDLKTDYVDQYLIHWPSLFFEAKTVTSKPHHVVWFEMEECVKQNLTRGIGVSNFNVQSLVNLLSFCNIKPVVNQVEISPYNQQPDLLDACKKLGIQVVAYSSLARGGLDTKKQLGAKIDIFNEPVLVDIAKKHNKQVAQVVLNYVCNTLGAVVLPKTETISRLRDNLDWQDFKLDEDDNQKIRKLDSGKRTIDPTTLAHFQHIDMFA